MASETDERVSEPTTRDNVLFYLTAFFCLVAVFSVFIFLFLVPFFIEPALATIYMEFDPEPVTCQTTEASFHRGLSNCQWSSCREGCTKEVYECWHIRVRYRSSVPVGLADSRSVRDRIAQHKTTATPTPSGVKPSVYYKSVHVARPESRDAASHGQKIQSVLPDDDDDNDDDSSFALSDAGGGGLHVHEARLQPNVKGCGYPPDVECNKLFAPTYGVVGANFSCYYSLVDPTLAITQLNINRVRSELVYCLTVPIICFLISVVYLLYAYFKLYADEPGGLSQAASGALVPGIGELDADGNLVVAEQPLDSPARLLFAAHPSPGGKRFASRVVRRARSGGAISASAKAARFEEPTVAPSVAPRGSMVPFDSSRVPRAKPAGHVSRGMPTSKSMGARFGDQSGADGRQQEQRERQERRASSTSSNLPSSRESSRSPSPSFSSSASSPSSRWSSTSARYPVSPDASRCSSLLDSALSPATSPARTPTDADPARARTRESVPLLGNDQLVLLLLLLDSRRFETSPLISPSRAPCPSAANTTTGTTMAESYHEWRTSSGSRSNHQQPFSSPSPSEEDVTLPV